VEKKFPADQQSIFVLNMHVVLADHGFKFKE
jgi:hypothetical protein